MGREASGQSRAGADKNRRHKKLRQLTAAGRVPEAVVPAPHGIHSEAPASRVIEFAGQLWQLPPDGTLPAGHLMHEVLRVDVKRG
jgi:hypothetical protein